MVAVSTKKKMELAERRRRVAKFYLNKMSQANIAEKLGVSQATISRDVAHLFKQWQKDAKVDIAQRVGYELAKLESLETDCAIQFAKTKEESWVRLRIRIQERVAKMLGLDAPTKSEITGAGGGPVDVTYTDKQRAGVIAELLERAGERVAGPDDSR